MDFHIPTQFQADIQQAQVGQQRYLQHGDWPGLDEAAAAVPIPHLNPPVAVHLFKVLRAHGRPVSRNMVYCWAGL